MAERDDPTGTDPADPDSVAAKAWFQKFITDHGIESWGTVDDAYNAWLAQINQGLRGQDALNGALAMLGWDRAANPANAAENRTTDSDYRSGREEAGGSLTAPYTGVFTPPTPQGIPGAPTFQPPAYEKPPAFSYGEFKAPTVGDMLAEPGYQFRESRGLGAIKNWLAHQGTYNSGATPKALSDYAQDYASGEYQNVFNRAADAHRLGYGEAASTYALNAEQQYRQPYEIAYRSALDTFAPQMTEWSTRAAANQRGDEMNYANAWQRYLFDYDKYRNQKLDTYNMLSNYLGS